MLGTKPLRRSGSFALTVILVVGALWIMAPIPPARAATTIPVTINSDTVADDGSCSLREAIAAANADTASGSSAGECPAGSGSDTITVPAMEISLEGSALRISSSVNLVGSGVGSTVVAGSPTGSVPFRDSVFFVSAGQVTLQGLTIRGGNAFIGGGVFVGTGSTVEISDARIVNNIGFSQGGGLQVQTGATVTVRRTTIDGNQSAQGGGISNFGMLFVHESLIGGDPPTGGQAAPGTGNVSTRFGGIVNSSGGLLNLLNTTVSGNSPSRISSAATGGITNFSFAFLNNVTITTNMGIGSGGRTGGLSTVGGATTVVNNSIIADNQGTDGATNDCNGALTTDSAFNLIEDTTGCGLPPIEQPPDPETFILNVDPKLDPLALNDGLTRNRLPASDSPVIDAGSPDPPGGPTADSCEPIDQRGIPRLLCDMGAVEREVVVPTALSVTTTADEVDQRPGNGTCATVSNTCSLRAAVQEANRLPGSQTIIVPAGVYDLSIPPDNENLLDPAAAGGGDLDLFGSVIVAGADQATVIVDGNDLSRIFDVVPNATASISGMTIRDGTDFGGGGVRVQTSSLTLDNVIVEDNESQIAGGGIEVGGLDSVLEIRNSIVRNNRAPLFGGSGGGIEATGQITINRTRIVGNQASGSGGGLRGSGVVSVIESTIANNKALFSFHNGGGISASGLNLVDSTVSGNTADAHGGGVSAFSGSIVNSTVSGNTSATRGGGVSTSGTLTLLHVTIADNKAVGGGNGLFPLGDSELSLQNTILADPSGTECAGLPPASKGNNIASDASCSLTAGGDRQTTDARINPLADNGGPTQTHLPRARSSAIDAAADVGLLRDQRGVRRPQGARPDIGSVERN